MAIVLNVLLLLVGFVLLIKGADFFVDGAASLATKLKIPSLIVGLTIVACGTSSPELAVSVSASLSGQNSLAISNVVGSNIFNLLIVLGICSIIIPSIVTKELLWRDYPVSIVAMVIFFFMIIFDGELGRIEAIILTAMLVGYLVWTVISAMKNAKKDDEESTKDFVWWKCALYIVGGIAGIIIGGDFVVDNASALGSALGMSETLVGLTICAIGTSLPELVTSIAAAKKGQNDIAMGNVIGSNILNVLGILGISGMITPIVINAEALTSTLVDSGVYIVVCLIAYVFCITGKKVTRVEGGVLAGMYVVYMAYIIMRDTGILA